MSSVSSPGLVHQSLWGRLVDRILGRKDSDLADPAAEAILRACEAAYGRLRTYQDRGTSVPARAERGATISFETRFRAPGAFFFHYRAPWITPEDWAVGCEPCASGACGVDQDPADASAKSALSFTPEGWIWTLNAPAARSWWTVQPKKPGEKTLQMAIAAHYGVSMTTSGMIASLLNRSFNEVTPITALRRAKVLRVEEVEGDACDVVGGIWASGLVKDPVEIAISRSTHLLRRVVCDPGSKDESTITFWPTINEPLGDDAFTFTPPVQPR